jgi:hypothetical protein
MLTTLDLSLVTYSLGLETEMENAVGTFPWEIRSYTPQREKEPDNSPFQKFKLQQISHFYQS